MLQLPPMSPLFPYTTLFRSDPPPRSIVLGFVDNMPDLIDACDLAVQNAGGLTSLEAMRRGCPLLITDASPRSEEHTSELQSRGHLVCRLLLEKKKYAKNYNQ